MEQHGGRERKRIDIISDTHGRLSPALMAQLEGADLIVHAGDLTSEADYIELQTVAPVRAVLGNNDYFYRYGPEVRERLRFEYAGLRFAVAHYREELPQGGVDVAVCGHTHRAQILQLGDCVRVNPGSPTYPRGMRGPTMARLVAEDGRIVSLEIIDLE